MRILLALLCTFVFIVPIATFIFTQPPATVLGTLLFVVTLFAIAGVYWFFYAVVLREP